MIESTDLIVPSGDGSVQIRISLGDILTAEIRQDEVAIVTPGKAPELLSTYNRAWRETHQWMSRLEAEKNRAEKALRNRKGVLILEVIPEKLRVLDMKSSVDIREAVIDTDAEYGALTDRVDQIKAAIMYLKGKLESFENAFTSVKKIMGESTYNFGGGPSMSGGTGDGRVGGGSSGHQTPPSGGGGFPVSRGGGVFGKPKF
jgi:hypothetical protein